MRVSRPNPRRCRLTFTGAGKGHRKWGSSVGTEDRESPDTFCETRAGAPHRHPCGQHTGQSSRPAGVDTSARQVPRGQMRGSPTCLVHHGSESCLDGRLAPLCCPDVMVRPILGRSQHLKELRRKHGFNADVLEGEAGGSEKSASVTAQQSQCRKEKQDPQVWPGQAQGPSKPSDGLDEVLDLSTVL